jgi:hypothetical protein
MLRAQDIYDQVPVYFCSRCLSLKILSLEDSDDPEACYCDDCGCTNIKTASIEKWEELYEAKYKRPHLKTKKLY